MRYKHKYEIVINIDKSAHYECVDCGHEIDKETFKTLQALSKELYIEKSNITHIKHLLESNRLNLSAAYLSIYDFIDKLQKKN